MPKSAKNRASRDQMGEVDELRQNLVHMARLGLAARPQDVMHLVRRVARKHAATHPQFAEELNRLLREAPTRSSPLRKEGMTQVPVDLDSRLQLLRVDMAPMPDVEPIYEDGVRAELGQIAREHQEEEKLLAAGLAPTRTALFTGPPGVGKSLGAKWLAHELALPLLTLDLSAVMSSYLGRTGTNVRAVLDYAKGLRCVLLLDEFDAIAKRRDDQIEVGELKRLVTVLLQEVDDWPEGGLLLAATNHASLLDPAIWRRFEVVIDFPMPDSDLVTQAVRASLGEPHAGDDVMVSILAQVFATASFSDIDREIGRWRRELVLSPGASLDDLIARRVGSLPRLRRKDIAVSLVRSGHTQRRANRVTGVSRDTIRAALAENKGG